MPTMGALADDVTRVIVSDVHGDHASLRELLRTVGAIDDRGERNDGFFCLQLGDLAHLGHDVYHDDAETLALGRRWLDVVLCGNHELYFAYGLQIGRWHGMHQHLIPEVSEQLRALVREGQLLPAWAVDDWLCTHAGVAELYLKQFQAGDTMMCAKAINRRFEGHLTRHRHHFDPLFDSDGYDPVHRPACLFWARPHIFSFYSGWAKQIVGHTPQGTRLDDGQIRWAPRQLREDIWINDVGAALSGCVSALVRRGAQGPWEPVLAYRPAG